MIAVVVLMRQNDVFSSFIFWSSISTRIPCFVVKLQPLCSHFWLFWKCGCNFQVISCGLERYALHKQTTNNGKTLYYCLLPIKKDKEGQKMLFDTLCNLGEIPRRLRKRCDRFMRKLMVQV